MRVCFFNRSYYPDLGATGQLLTELAEDLVDGGCEVSVVAGMPLVVGDPTWRAPTGVAPVTREERHGVSVFRARGTTFSPRVLTGKFVNYLTYFGAAALAGLRLPRLDVVVTLTDPPIIGLVALGVARRHGARLVFLCQDIYPEAGRLLAGVKSRAINGVLDSVSRLLVRQADRVIALGETMRQRLIEGKGADPAKVVVIHNWADCELITPRSKRNRFSQAHGLADKFVVMHSGNLGLSQNLPVLIEAAERLRDLPDLVVVIVGEGASKRALEAAVRDKGLSNVRFLPYTPKAQLAEAFGTADVFVVGLKQGLAGYIVPSKVYGILAAGRPFVAAAEESSEPAQIARQFECGLVVKPGDTGELERAIRWLYGDAALRRKLGDNARAAALQFDRRVAVRRYLELFQFSLMKPLSLG